MTLETPAGAAPAAGQQPERRPRPTRHRGPVMLRGGEPDPQTMGTTTDQRLLDRRGPTDWVHTDPWRVLRIQSEFVEGFGLLAELPRAVSVFGSARTPRDHPYYEAGVALGAALSEAGYAVITGGGPGDGPAARTPPAPDAPPGAGHAPRRRARPADRRNDDRPAAAGPARTDRLGAHRPVARPENPE